VSFVQGRALLVQGVVLGAYGRGMFFECMQMRLELL
jgi:hypothetical protein